MAGILSIVIWIVVIVGIVKSFSGSDTKKTQSTQNSTQKTVQQIRNGAQKIMSEISAYANDMEQGTNTGNRTSYNQPQNSAYNTRTNQSQNSAYNTRTNQPQTAYNAKQNAYAQPTQQKRQMTADERARLDAYRQQKAFAQPAAKPTNICPSRLPSPTALATSGVGTKVSVSAPSPCFFSFCGAICCAR